MSERANETNILWRVRLFDGPALDDGMGNSIRHFRSQRIGVLLAYLALRLGRPVPREELCEALWPDEDLSVAANRLRVALNSLRRQLEPPGVPFGTVLDASEPGRLRLRAQCVWCDVAAFETAQQAGRRDQAANLSRGTLLPGYYDEWILSERERLVALRESLGQLDSSDRAEIIARADPPSTISSAIPVDSPPVLLQRLPLYLTRFFGREREINDLAQLTHQHRLVTITGIGGIGKTRLAVETAREMNQSCLFVPLADLPDQHRIPEAILGALMISTSANRDPQEHLIDVLQRHDPLLLILDNAEHLLDSVATLGLRLLETVVSLRLLITSRQRLMVPGEASLPLTPLEPPTSPVSAEQLAQFPALALFLDRARIARPDFFVSRPQLVSLVEICRHLEGLPLALELAAARVSAQSLSQIAGALAQSVTSLKSSQRSLSARHRSLRSAIQGSIDLLSPDLQAFFAMLSVFQGGWTVDAARVVTGFDEAEEFLEALYLRSLVVPSEDAETGVLRYSFLETLRQFAAELCTPAWRAGCDERHTRYFLTLAAGVNQDDTRTFTPLDSEPENLRLALERGSQTSPIPDKLYWDAIIGVLEHAYVRGHQRIAIVWAQKALATVASVADARIRARVRYAATGIYVDLGRLDEANQIAGEIKADSEACGDIVGVLLSETVRGFVAENAGRFDEAVQIMRHALQQSRSLHDLPLFFVSLSLTSSALLSYGIVIGPDTDLAKGYFHEAETLARELLSLVSPYSRRLPLAKFLISLSLSRLGNRRDAYLMLKETQVAAISGKSMTILMYSLIYECQYAIENLDFEYAAILYGAFLRIQEQIGYNTKSMQSHQPDWIQKIEDEIRTNVDSHQVDFLIDEGSRRSYKDISTRFIEAPHHREVRPPAATPAGGRRRVASRRPV